MQNKGRFPVLALAGYFKAERLVGEACEDLRGRYTFTGKELDEESNLYYYDARYNSSTYSQFTAVDPMSDKYPAVNPYLYCAGNPIKYVDPDGREFDEASEKIALKDQERIEAKKNELEAKLKTEKSLTKRIDMKRCIKELSKSYNDINLMLEDENHIFTYSPKEGNEAGFNLDDIHKKEVSIDYCSDSQSDFETRIHEDRHWGDILRGKFNKNNYSRRHEISAYRAQYAARRGDMKMYRWFNQETALPQNITSIYQIIDDFIYTLANRAINPELVYNFPKAVVKTK